jgi:hypothetical protein
MIYFFNVGRTVWFPPPKCLTYYEHNMLLNFPQCLSILLLQTSKTGNNALDIDAIYNLKLRKTFKWTTGFETNEEVSSFCQ